MTSKPEGQNLGEFLTVVALAFAVLALPDKPAEPGAPTEDPVED